MKTPLCSPLALAAVVASSAHFASAFVPATPTFAVRTAAVPVVNHEAAAVVSRGRNLSMAKGDFLGVEDDDDEDDDYDDDDDDDDDDEPYLSSDRYGSSSSPFSGLEMDPWDPNPLVKPRPSKYFGAIEDDDIVVIPDSELMQSMSQDERAENLKVIRQIENSDLAELNFRQDWAGVVEATKDKKKRIAKDPWFGVNKRIEEAYKLGEPVEELINLAMRLGGPPPGVNFDHRASKKPYALVTEIYEPELSAESIQDMLEKEMLKERIARGKAMQAEAQKNAEAAKRERLESMENPRLREQREGQERRERNMGRIQAELEEERKKKQEKVKEMLGKIPEKPLSRTEAMQKALEEAKAAMRQTTGSDAIAEAKKSIIGETAEMSSADRAREAAANEASGGRPRLPGDADVTRGELSIEVEGSSSATTGPLEVQVSSVYNVEKSDPTMRKHCFQYTIRITNHSPADTIQLLGRRFEIQTVGSSMKDVVEGVGVTGRTPILKPGESFEYTSTAPLSVRPLGTTIIAARMKGVYRYTVLGAGQETASEAQLEAGGESTAELGTFHFIFPEEHRVKPFRSEDVDDDEDEDEDEDEDDDDVSPAAVAAPAAAPKSPASPAPASTLPGDADMTSGKLAVSLNDKSDEVTDQVRVQVTSSYRTERSDPAQDKHCFAYNIRITNERKDEAVQLVSRRFEIQTVGSPHKDVVQGPGVTGRQPILQPGESFEYTSTAPLSVKPLLDKTPAVARMQGEYNFVVLSDDNTTPLSSTPLKAKLGMFHFVLPALV